VIRLTVPSIDRAEIDAVREVLESGYLVQGRKVAEFEKLVAQYVGVEHAIAVSSCTAALHLSLLSLGIGPGDIVCTSAYSWPATANVVELCGAQVEFVDICPRTFNLDAQRLDERLTCLMSKRRTARRVKAILPVHAFGQLSNMLAILGVADRFGIPVVEDAACALGAKCNNQSAGSWGVCGCFSFHPRKAITTGEGGMIMTNDEALARRLRVLRNHGMDQSAAPPDFVLPGFNYRMTDLQGAIGTAQMSKLDRIITARRRLAQTYRDMLTDSRATPPFTPEKTGHVYQSYVTLLPEELAPSRSELIAKLRSQGVETTMGTWHVPLTRNFRRTTGAKSGDFPVTDKIASITLTLPLYEGLCEADQQTVVDTLTSVMATC